MQGWLAVVAILGTLGASRWAAADDEIVTDRPDVAESSETVGKLRLQVETGADIETTKVGDGRTTALRLPTKVRFGLLDRWEIHVESGWLSHDRVSGGGASASDTGLDDVGVGTKVHFLDGGGLVPSMGTLLTRTVPVGSDGHSGEAFALSPTVAADWALTDAWGVASNVGLTIALSERDLAADTFRFALGVGRSWAPLTDRVRTYLEIFGETVLDGGATALSVDGGFTVLLRPQLQLDLSVRAGLTDEAPDLGGGLGVSFKL